MHTSKGFTLIELLMSIAIIAILSTLILSGLSSARGRSNDSKIKSQLTSLRTAAENYHESAGTFGSASDCSSGMFATSELNMSTYTTEASYPAETHLTCNANGADYAVSANLTGGGGYWCVDARGSKYLAADPGDVVICP
ncbi:type II secretion system protein [Candidatus Parcubacteria bacterium]|nr:type II secretion system protein [Candidatus Parcubacteria bacterium]